MMGRVTDVEGIPSPSKTFYVAALGHIWDSNPERGLGPWFLNSGGGAQGALADPGIYTVTLSVGGQEYSSTRTVERLGG